MINRIRELEEKNATDEVPGSYGPSAATAQSRGIAISVNDSSQSINHTSRVLYDTKYAISGSRASDPSAVDGQVPQGAEVIKC